MLADAVDFGKIRELLVTPTAENVHRAAGLLQSVADELAALNRNASRLNLASEQNLRISLEAVQAEMQRLRGLLGSAAKFHNLIAGAHTTLAYQANGLWTTPATAARTLAQL